MRGYAFDECEVLQMLINCHVLVDRVVLWTDTYILEYLHDAFVDLLIENFDTS